MDIETGQAPAPRWFMAAAIGALIFYGLGCYAYLSQMGVDPATLPADQRTMWDATPAWMTGAYAVGVWAGLVGAILLLLRRRLAEPLLLVALLAVVVQFSGLILVPALRNLVSSDMLLLPFVVVMLCGIIWHFARRARRSGWLR